MVQEMITAFVILGSVIILCLTVLLAQGLHYDQVNSKREYVNLKSLSDEYAAGIKELKEIKSKVDTLVLKAGFRL